MLEIEKLRTKIWIDGGMAEKKVFNDGNKLELKLAFLERKWASLLVD